MHITRTQLRGAQPLALKLRDAPAVASLATFPLVLALALFLATRRALGAMSAPLAALPLIATAIAMLLWVWCIRLAARNSIVEANTSTLAMLRAVAWGPLVSLVLFAFACSFPGARLIDWLIWLPAIAAAWFGPPSLAWVRRQSWIVAGAPPHLAPISHDATEQVLQQLTRFRTAEGHDAIRGTLTAEFAAGQRTADLYVSFCPPFERLPEVEVEVDGQDSADVKLIQALHNGAQFEVRLVRGASSSQFVNVQFYGIESPADY